MGKSWICPWEKINGAVIRSMRWKADGFDLAEKIHGILQGSGFASGFLTF